MSDKPSELLVITKAKDLCSYVMTVTQKSPKQFRFTFVSRMQNLCLSVIENLYRANDVFALPGDQKAFSRRLNYQHEAATDLRILCYFSELAMTQQCIPPKQYEQISVYAPKPTSAWVRKLYCDRLKGIDIF